MTYYRLEIPEVFFYFMSLKMKLRSTGECTQPVALSLKWYDTSHEEQFSKAGTECVKQQLQSLVCQVLVQVIQMPHLDRNPLSL